MPKKKKKSQEGGCHKGIRGNPMPEATNVKLKNNPPEGTQK